MEKQSQQQPVLAGKDSSSTTTGRLKLKREPERVLASPSSGVWEDAAVVRPAGVSPLPVLAIC